jgi:hypothetical protein
MERRATVALLCACLLLLAGCSELPATDSRTQIEDPAIRTPVDRAETTVAGSGTTVAGSGTTVDRAGTTVDRTGTIASNASTATPAPSTATGNTAGPEPGLTNTATAGDGRATDADGGAIGTEHEGSAGGDVDGSAREDLDGAISTDADGTVGAGAVQGDGGDASGGGQRASTAEVEGGPSPEAGPSIADTDGDPAGGRPAAGATENGNAGGTAGEAGTRTGGTGDDPRAAPGEPTAATAAADDGGGSARNTGGTPTRAARDGDRSTDGALTPSPRRREASDPEVPTDAGRSTATTAPASTDLRIDRVALDAGRVVFRNAGDEPIDLTGYAIIANGIELYRFPTLVLGPGETVTLHVGTGTDTESDLYAGYDRSIPGMGEYTVTVEDDEGDVVVRRSKT